MSGAPVGRPRHSAVAISRQAAAVEADPGG